MDGALLSPGVVQIVGPTDGWVLEKLARVLAARLPYAEFVPWTPRPNGVARLAYYVNYALYAGPSGLIDVGFFTHRDDSFGFLERARQMDCCVCMAAAYADWLRANGGRDVVHIPMGYDEDRFRPTLVLAVIGTLDHPRKGRDLVERVRSLPFVEVLTTEGRLTDDELRVMYQRADYILIPATVEGGPLALLEGLAMGKRVIAPAGVGVVPEFDEHPDVITYPAGDSDALVRVVSARFQRKRSIAAAVADRGYDRWVKRHHEVFARLFLGRRANRPLE